MKVTIPVTGQAFDLNPKQEEFVDCAVRYPLFIGGMGSGKTLAFLIKVLIHSSVPNNYGLVGRENLSDLKVSVWKDFFDLVPDRFIRRRNLSEHTVTFTNGSEILFRQLKDVSRADIRSLNLGWFGIEQAEETDESIFLELQGRLRRKEAHIRQGFLIANPSISWLLKYWKQQKDDDFKCIETSTFDNEAHLPPDYVANMTRGKPEWWIKQFVYGIWDTSLLSERAVFGRDVIVTAQSSVIEKDGDERLTIYEEPAPGVEYLIGIDPTEGVGGDPAYMAGFNLRTGVQVFDWSAQIPPELLADEAATLSDKFNNAMMVPEINGAGYATTAFLKTKGLAGRLYRRKEYDRATSIMVDRLGFRTTAATKPLMISRLSEQVLDKSVIIRSPRVLAQMQTFVYTDEARKNSMGAEIGYHDDGVIAAALAAHAIYEYSGKAAVFPANEKLPIRNSTIVVDKNNRITPPKIILPGEQSPSWMTS